MTRKPKATKKLSLLISRRYTLAGKREIIEIKLTRLDDEILAEIEALEDIAEERRQ